MTQYKPDRRVVWTWVLCVLLVAIVLAAASLWLWRWQVLPNWVGNVFTLAWGITLSLILAVYIPLRWRKMTYTLDKSHIISQSGVLFRVEHRMPLSGVRHVTLIQGPLERRFGTAFLLVNGAGGFVLLEGLSLEQATAWRQSLLEQ